LSDNQKNNLRKINVLHLFEMAAGPSIQSHFYKKFGYGKSWVLSKYISKSLIGFYCEVENFPRVRHAILAGLKRCKNDEVDIVFIHGTEFAVPIFKILTRKKIILQYHGSDINLPGRSHNLLRIICRSMANAIIYNQKSHLDKIITIRKIRKEYHPNAVDTEHFKPQNKNRNGSLTFISSNLNREKTMEELKKIPDLTIIDSNKQKFSYEEMPDLLNQYEKYIDYKVTDFGLVLKALSRTALEALACGCKVYHDEKIIEQLPEEHKPEIVMKKLYSLFLDILTKK